MDRHATRDGAFGAFDHPENFKTLRRNFEICRNVRKKDEILHSYILNILFLKIIFS